MKRKTLVKIHIAATIIAAITIGTFFISSLVAEVDGDKLLILDVKEKILFAIPLLFITMPALALTGKKLAGHSQSEIIKAKQWRMKFIVANGVLLTILAAFLYYRSHYREIDTVFMVAQLAEFALGVANLILISLNVRSGLQLSGRLKRKFGQV